MYYVGSLSTPVSISNQPLTLVLLLLPGGVGVGIGVVPPADRVALHAGSVSNTSDSKQERVIRASALKNPKHIFWKYSRLVVAMLSCTVDHWPTCSNCHFPPQTGWCIQYYCSTIAASSSRVDQLVPVSDRHVTSTSLASTR